MESLVRQEHDKNVDKAKFIQSVKDLMAERHGGDHPLEIEGV